MGKRPARKHAKGWHAERGTRTQAVLHRSPTPPPPPSPQDNRNHLTFGRWQSIITSSTSFSSLITIPASDSFPCAAAAAAAAAAATAGHHSAVPDDDAAAPAAAPAAAATKPATPVLVFCSLETPFRASPVHVVVVEGGGRA